MHFFCHFQPSVKACRSIGAGCCTLRRHADTVQQTNCMFFEPLSAHIRPLLKNTFLGGTRMSEIAFFLLFTYDVRGCACDTTVHTTRAGSNMVEPINLLLQALHSPHENWWPRGHYIPLITTTSNVVGHY